jgi:lambda family phage minor tail protein L
MSEPTSHIVESQKLTADGVVELFEIVLNDNSHVYIKNNNTVTWQGIAYEGMPLKMSGVSANADEEQSRPTMVIFNPENMFGSFVANGVMEKALVIRRRVLYVDLLANNNIASTRRWLVGRVTSLTQQSLTVELRNLTDGPNFVVPRRMYTPPDFPVVSLS